MGLNVVPLVVIAMVPIITGSFGQRAIGKRSSSAANGIANVDYPDYPAKYDDYPVSKRIDTPYRRDRFSFLGFSR